MMNKENIRIPVFSDSDRLTCSNGHNAHVHTRFFSELW